MRESSVYQMILKEGRDEGREEGKQAGRIEEVRALLIRLGRKRLGSPDEAVRSAIESIDDLARLEELMDRVVECQSWAEVFADGGS